MNRIKDLRKDMGILQQELANRLGVKQVTVSSWEVGNSYPTVPTLLELSKIFGCSIDYIVGNESEEGIVNITQEISYEQELLLSLLKNDKTYSTLLKNFCKLTEIQKNSILTETRNLALTCHYTTICLMGICMHYNMCFYTPFYPLPNIFDLYIIKNQNFWGCSVNDKIVQK